MNYAKILFSALSGMLPRAQHVGAFGWQQPLFDQKRDDPCAEEFLQRREAHLGHHMEKPAFGEEPVGNQGVEVGVEVEVFAERMNGHHDAGHALGQPQRGALELGQTGVGDAAEFLDEPPMKPEIGAQHLGDGEREMPVRYGREDGLGQQCAEELHLLLVARRAEFNLCRPKGIQGSNTYFLICAVAVRRDLVIFTTDRDFRHFARLLPIVLHGAKGPATSRQRRSAPRREA